MADRDESFNQIVQLEGRLRRKARGTGPIPDHGTELVLETSSFPEDDAKIENLLRGHEGCYLRITIEQHEADAKRKPDTTDVDTQFPNRRRRWNQKD